MAKAKPRVLDIRVPYSGTVRLSMGSPVGRVVELMAHADGSVTWQYVDEED